MIVESVPAALAGERLDRIVALVADVSRSVAAAVIAGGGVSVDDETVTSDPAYVDPNPGATTAHKYWVTAVDQDFNESPASDPVQSPPVT